MRKMTVFTILALFTTAMAMTIISVSAMPASAAGKKCVYSTPLTWRADGAGQFKFDGAVNLSSADIERDGSVTTGSSKGTCELEMPYQSDGIITSISANWTFTGQVTMEVTATGNSKDYVAVTNGVPVAAMTPGSKLKWRATLAPESALTEVKIAYKDLSGASGTFGNPDLSGFTKRIRVVIAAPSVILSEAKNLKDSSAPSALQNDNSDSQSLFNYQMPIKVGESAGAAGCDVYLKSPTQSDLTDIRFTQADGETALPYYRESVIGTKPNRIVTFWVKIPEIPRNASLPLYMYYNAKNAPDLSDPNKVFDFFEDFNAAKLDTGTWKVTLENKTAQAALAGSMLVLDEARATTVKNVFGNGILEYRAKVAANGAVVGIIAAGAAAATDLSAYSSIIANRAHCIMQGDKVIANDPKMLSPDTFYDFKVILDGQNITFQRYADGVYLTEKPQAETKATVILSEASPVILTLNEVKGKDLKDSSSPSASQNDMKRMTQIGLFVGLGGSGLYCDWIRTRQYASAPPQVDVNKTAAQAEEVMDLPVFYNLTLAPDGSVMLDPKAASDGLYTSQLIKAPFQARVMTASSVILSEASPVILTLNEVKGKDLKDSSALSALQNDISISTDGGKTFTTGWKNGVARYSSKNDFAKGDQLRWKAVIARSSSSVITLTRFTLAYEPGSIRIIMPSGGEAIKPGTQYGIFWETKGYDADYQFDLYYSTDGGTTFSAITGPSSVIASAGSRLGQNYSSSAVEKDNSALARTISNSGTYTWTVPQVESDKVILMAGDPADKSVYGVSDNYFTISQSAGEGTITASPVILSEASPVILTLNEVKGKDLKDSSALSALQNDKTPVIPAEAGIQKPGEAVPPAPPGTQLYELLIKVGDNAPADPKEDQSGYYKEGDIVVIKPAGFNWSDTEKKSFLILKSYLTEKEVQKLMQPKETVTGKDKQGRDIIRKDSLRKYKIDFAKQGIVRGKTAGMRDQLPKDKPIVKTSALEEKQ